MVGKKNEVKACHSCVIETKKEDTLFYLHSTKFYMSLFFRGGDF